MSLSGDNGRRGAERLMTGPVEKAGKWEKEEEGGGGEEQEAEEEEEDIRWEERGQVGEEVVTVSSLREKASRSYRGNALSLSQMDGVREGERGMRVI